MKAFTKFRYGGPEVLNLQDVTLPPLKPNEVSVQVRANSLNAADWHILRGKPFVARFTTGLFKPSQTILGADFAGIVLKVGEACQRLKPGDFVFGESLLGGAFAENIHIDEEQCALIPSGLDFLQMACLPIAGITALQAIDTHAKLQAGERILIHGASGGVGHFAIQIASARGAHVTAVCSSRNKPFVLGLGAQQVIAYDDSSIHSHSDCYDVVMDTYGNLNFSDFKRMGKRGVLTGFTSIGHMAKVMLAAKISNYPLAQFTANSNVTDLNTLAKMVATSAIKPHMQKVYSFEDIPQGISELESMRTRGKLAVSWE